MFFFLLYIFFQPFAGEAAIFPVYRAFRVSLYTVQRPVTNTWLSNAPGGMYQHFVTRLKEYHLPSPPPSPSVSHPPASQPANPSSLTNQKKNGTNFIPVSFRSFSFSLLCCRSDSNSDFRVQACGSLF